MFWFLYNELPQACKFIKKRLGHKCFPVNFVKFLRTSFLHTNSGGCFWMFRSNYKELFLNLTGRRASVLKMWSFINDGACHRSFSRTFRKMSNCWTVKLNQSWIFPTFKRSKKTQTNSPGNSPLFFTLFSPQVRKVVLSLFEVKSFIFL